MQAAEDQNVRGQAVTPFILSRIGEATHRRALLSNMALVRNNARVAARIAQRVAYQSRFSSSSSASPPPLLVVGGSTRDITFQLSEPPRPGSTTYGALFESWGGVGRTWRKPRPRSAPPSLLSASLATMLPARASSTLYPVDTW